MTPRNGLNRIKPATEWLAPQTRQNQPEDQLPQLA
jgi:hypothetical protein